MALRDLVPELLRHINEHNDYIEHNKKLFEIYEGDLKKHVLIDMERSLSSNYFEKIKHRVLPINVLKRIIDKSAKVYSDKPERIFSSNEELAEDYEKIMEVDVNANDADEFSHLFKGYAFEPYFDEREGVPRLRVIPYDRFLVWSDDKIDPTNVTVFIKFMGKKSVLVPNRRFRSGYETQMRQVYFAYSNDEFWAFDDRGDDYMPAMEENEGENPFGVIPFVYGNRSRYELVPTQDTDILQLTKSIPVMLSGLSGAILFQCFSIIWGIDVDAEDMTMSPNAFWSLKSDKDSDKNPQVGTIKPEADVVKVMGFVFDVLSCWLETRGIKAGSIGSTDVNNVASGVAKIIDEMDTTELRKKSIQFFKVEEKKLWRLISLMHNYWVESGVITGKERFADDFSVTVEFDDPQPVIDREKEVRTKKMEVDSGFLSTETAIKQLNPDWDDEFLEEEMQRIESEGEINGEDGRETDGEQEDSQQDGEE